VGLDATLATMIGWSLTAGNLQSAQLLYGELQEKDPKLGRRIQKHLQRRDDRNEELQTLRQEALDHDPSRARKARGRLGIGLALLWLVVPAMVHALTATGRLEYTYELSHLSQGGAWIVTVALVIAFRKTMFLGKVNRRLMFALLAMIPAMGLAVLVTKSIGLTPMESVATRTVALAGACAVMGIAIDPRLWGAAAAYAMAALLSALRPDLALLLQALGNLAALASVGVAWTVGRDAPEDRRELLRETADLAPVADPYDWPPTPVTTRAVRRR